MQRARVPALRPAPEKNTAGKSARAPSDPGKEYCGQECPRSVGPGEIGQGWRRSCGQAQGNAVAEGRHSCLPRAPKAGKSARAPSDPGKSGKAGGEAAAKPKVMLWRRAGTLACHGRRKRARVPALRRAPAEECSGQECPRSFGPRQGIMRARVPALRPAAGRVLTSVGGGLRMAAWIRAGFTLARNLCAPCSAFTATG
jgi:hypothetical protein